MAAPAAPPPPPESARHAGAVTATASTPAAVTPSTVPVAREIVCDESGYEGEKLIGGTTAVFTHGSVLMDSGAADELMAELRRRIRSPATQYKANHLLRERHRKVLVWFLGEVMPGRGHVFAVDKSFFIAARLVGLLSTGVSHLPGMRAHAGVGDRDAALGWYERHRHRDDWAALLTAGNDMMRGKERWDLDTHVDAFFDLLGDDPLRRGRAYAEAFRLRLLDEPATIPAMDPLIPAIVRTAAHWGASTPVAMVHDRQNALSPERVTQLKAMAPELASLRLAAAHDDSRILLADMIGGTARKILEEDLAGRGDAELTALVWPYVDGRSVWVRPAGERGGSGVDGRG